MSAQTRSSIVALCLCCTCLWCVWLFCLPCSTQAQAISAFRRLTVEQGLSQSSAYAILADRAGFIWIGTADGLNKYDGYTFTVYRHVASDSTSLSDNFIRALLEDRSGACLWVGTRDGGLNRLDRTTGKCTAFRHNPHRSSLSSDYVTCIAQDSAGVLWVGTDGGGLNRFDPKTSTCTAFQYSSDAADNSTNNSTKTIASNTVFALCFGADGALWIGTDKGLSRLDVRAQTFSHLRKNPNSSTNFGNSNNAQSISNDAVRTLALDPHDGSIWAGTDEGLNRIDARTQHATRYLHDPNNPTSITDDAISTLWFDRFDYRGELWVGTVGGGVNRFDRRTEKFTAYRGAAQNLRAFGGSAVYSLFQDNAGLMWVGTYSGGVITFRARPSAFITLTHDPANPTSPNHLNRFAVSALFDDPSTNALWVGTLDGGVNRLDRASGTFTVFRHDDTNDKSLPSDVVRAVLRDRAGGLWIATQNGLARLNADGSTFTTYRNEADNPRSLSSNNVFCLFEDTHGGLWVGTLGGGVNRFNRATNDFTVFKHDARNPQSLSGNTIRAICQDSSGALWIGTRGAGLNRYKPETQEWTRLTRDETNAHSISSNSIYALYVQKNGMLWIGTQGGGVNRFNPSTLDFTAFRMNDGLPNDVLYGILEDKRGNLWFSTNKGIARMNLQASKEAMFRNYDVRDGLQSNEFNAGAFCAGSDGRLYFGGIRGFTAFHPDSVVDNPFVPPVTLTGFKLFNRAVQPAGREVSTLDTITISYRDNYFAFEFAALNFFQSEKNRYRYKLDGFDGSWIDAGTRREAAYTNLDPGVYIFRVQGSNDDGIWNTHGTSVVLIITPPFWQQWWFRALAVVCGLGAAIGFMIWRLQAVRKAESISRQIAQLELQSLRLHMNPHFIFNSINSIQYLVAEEQTQAATHYLSTFARLMRKILKQTDYLAIPIADEIELLGMYADLERLRYDYTFEYELHCGHRSELASLLIPAMVIQPYIENAIRHGLGTRRQGGKLVVTIERHGGEILCVVEDNGIGRERAHELQRTRALRGDAAINLSIATSVTQRRLELMNTSRQAATKHRQTPHPISVRTIDLHDEHGNPAGTRVEITLPVLRASA